MTEARDDIGRGSRLAAALLAIAFGVTFTGLYAVAVLTPLGQRWDAASLGAFGWLPRNGWLGAYGLRNWIPPVLVGAAAIAGVEALIRRRWRALVAAALLMTLCAAASFLFKAGLLPRPVLGAFAYPYNTFPSGHTAICLAAVVVVVWLAPRWLHPALVVIMGAAAVAAAIASLLSLAHRGSDIVGGTLMVGMLSFGICAILGTPLHGTRSPRRRRWSIAGAVGVALAVVVVLAGGGAADSSGLAVGLAAAGITALVLTSLGPVRSPSGW